MKIKQIKVKNLLKILLFFFIALWIVLQLIHIIYRIQGDLVGLNRTVLGFFYTKIIVFDPEQTAELFHGAYALYLILAFGTAIIGSLIISKGRTLTEALAIFVAFIIPDRKKLSGRVFDVQTGGNIPFVTIQVLTRSENREFLIARAITDFEGRYKVSISKKESEMYISVRINGYYPYRKPVTNIFKNNVIQDIPLESTNDIKSKIKTIYFYYLKPKFYIYFAYYLLVLSIISFIGAIYSLRVLGISPFTLTFSIIYGLSVIWNIYIILERVRFSVGKVIDFDLKTPIPAAAVGIFHNNNQIQVAYTNEKGIVRLNSKDDFYKINVTKSGYKMVDNEGNTVNFEELFLTKDGYLPKNIYLKADTERGTNTFSLDNPFSD